MTDQEAGLAAAVHTLLERCKEAQDSISDVCEWLPYDTNDELLLDDVHMKINEAMDLVRQRFLPKRTL